MSEEAAKYTAPNIKAKAAQIAPPAEPHNQPGDLIIGEPGAPADVRLGMRLVGDDELATVTITQRNKTTTLAFTDSAHAARIADALLGYQPYAVVVSAVAAGVQREPEYGSTPQYINDAIDNLAHANYELSYGGYQERTRDVELIRAYVARAAQPAEQPVSWIRISGDHVILSRCNWMYPASTEDSAGTRDEQRFTAVGRRDGDIVLPAPEGSLDREDLKTMLAWPSASKPAEQRPFEWPLLDAPALIGGAVVGKGCSTGTVVAIAKRAYQYAVETSPEEHARREKAFKNVLAQIREGINQSGPEQMPGENAPDVAGLVEALEGALSGRPLDTEFWDRCEQFIAAHRKQGSAAPASPAARFPDCEMECGAYGSYCRCADESKEPSHDNQ